MQLSQRQSFSCWHQLAATRSKSGSQTAVAMTRWYYQQVANMFQKWAAEQQQSARELTLIRDSYVRLYKSSLHQAYIRWLWQSCEAKEQYRRAHKAFTALSSNQTIQALNSWKSIALNIKLQRCSAQRAITRFSIINAATSLQFWRQEALKLNRQHTSWERATLTWEHRFTQICFSLWQHCPLTRDAMMQYVLKSMARFRLHYSYNKWNSLSLTVNLGARMAPRVARSAHW